MLYHKLNYSKIGNGKHKVVFLHGWGASADSFMPIASQMQNCTCYLIDLYGFGQSSMPKVMDTYDYAMQLYLFFVSLKLNNFTLVCHSFGGRIGIILSSLFDIKIKKLVLIDSAGLKPRFNIITKYKIISYKIVKKLVKYKLLNKNILQKFGSKDLQNAKSHLKISFVKIVNQDLRYLTTKINAQTLIVWGTKDKTTPVYMAKWLHKNIAKSQVVFYVGDHFACLNNYNFAIKLNNFIRG